MEGLPVIITVLLAAAGQFSVLWWRIGKIEGRINGKINGSYFKCPFYKGRHQD
ncbi:hypothetical protein LCGC14_1694130 [marine sediment metagenome]|uniref:Uncharacterized protein n=1 Tax=marine sediment metagenome TaxID=412755 RepID=A0A0F9HJZ1_9ZZZZ